MQSAPSADLHRLGAHAHLQGQARPLDLLEQPRQELGRDRVGVELPGPDLELAGVSVLVRDDGVRLLQHHARQHGEAAVTADPLHHVFADWHGAAYGAVDEEGGGRHSARKRELGRRRGS